MRLKCLTVTTNQTLFLFRRDSDEHGHSGESEKAKQMVKKKVNITNGETDKVAQLDLIWKWNMMPSKH